MPVSKQADNAALNFRMPWRAAFETRPVLEEFIHSDHEAFPSEAEAKFKQSLTHQFVEGEEQSIKTYFLNDREFEHKYRVDVTLPTGGFLPGVLQVGIDDSSLELQQKLDEEYTRLEQDRHLLRLLIFRGRDASISHYLPVNLLRLAQNVSQNFHIDRRKLSDLDHAFTVDAD